ncbi:RDD family protein [Arthrobacter sp. NEB 688]|uniref:RDD family protein n=1 Tax=Arthrobacter sp. NEB 688 TaxID=904039 RepID=UPI001566E306|nr:RDD family protein [Arthrobacter sp. NEB 688]QKE82693.1 RDD family protein [Arthrobacter sp. NEB 688]
MSDQHPPEPTSPQTPPTPGAPASAPQPYPAPAAGQGYPPQQPPPGAQQNPYGGWTTAPAFSGGQAPPESVPYVEAHFGPVASFGDRVLALLIDTAASFLPLLLMLAGIPFIVAGAPDRTGVDEYGMTTYGDTNGALIAVGIAVIVLFWLVGVGFQLWNRVFRMGRRGQSIGKSVVGLKLVDARTGAPIGAGSCFVRELVSGVVNSAVYLSYLWMLWDDNRQTVADKAVHSTVIKVPKA